MIKILLFLEHKFWISDNGDIFCEKVITNEYLSRYLDVFDSICLCARVLEKKPLNLIEESLNKDKISILPLPNYNSSQIIKHFKECSDIISRKISEFNGSIIRGPSSISLLAYYVLNKNKVPFIAEIVINPRNFFNTDTNNLKNKLVSSLGKSMLVRHTKKMCMNANGVSYVTKYFLQNLFPSHSMRYGSSDIYFNTFYSSINLKPSDYSNFINNHIEGEPFIITHTGWMVGDNKGHKIVMDVAKALISKGYNIRVKFIGDGIKKNEFESYAKKRNIVQDILFLGQINDFESIQKQLLSSHLFLFPSKAEGLPRVLIEAMANSLPCIASNVDGIPELIDEQYLVEYNDIDKMVYLIEQFINNESLRKRICKQNYMKSLEYSDEVLSKKRRDFYNKYRNLVS